MYEVTSVLFSARRLHVLFLFVDTIRAAQYSIFCVLPSFTSHGEHFVNISNPTTLVSKFAICYDQFQVNFPFTKGQKREQP